MMIALSTVARLTSFCVIAPTPRWMTRSSTSSPTSILSSASSRASTAPETSPLSTRLSVSTLPSCRAWVKSSRLIRLRRLASWTARQIAEKREAAERAAQLAKRRKRISLEDFTQALQLGKVETLNLVLKGDVSGAVEALEDALLKIDVGEEVELRVIHRGVGAITQNDVNLATVDSAIIIGFNVKFAERVEALAERE